MRFSMPKPLDGWRAFVGEVGTIVLAVLIALGAQQGVDSWRWQQDVERTKADLDDEILYNVSMGAERIAVNRCLAGKLKEMAAAVVKNSERWTALENMASGRQTALPVVYRAPSRVYTTDAWEQAKAYGILNHMKPADVQNYSATYQQIVYLRSLDDDEQRLIPKLSFLGFDGALDPASRERALTAMASLDARNSWLVLVAEQLADAAAKSKRRLSRAVIADLRERLNLQREVRGACVDEAAAWKMLDPLMAK